MSAVRGVTTWRFRCSFEDADLVRSRLPIFRYVDLDRCTYEGGELLIRVDLARLPYDDAPALRLSMERDLQAVVARKRLPSTMPPAAVTGPDDEVA